MAKKSMIASEVSTLDKLAWAIFPEKVKIARAAYMLRQKGYSLWDLDSDQTAKRELRLLVHETAPGRGKIMAREAEIKEEVSRQSSIAGRRKAARPEPFVTPTKFRRAFRYPTTDDRNYAKEQLMREFGRKLGIDSLIAFDRRDEYSLYFGGGWSGIRDVYVQPRKNGLIYKVETNGWSNYTTNEDLLASLVFRAIDVAIDVISKEIMLEGAKLSSSYREMATILEYPDGRTTRYEWNTKPVFPEFDG